METIETVLALIIFLASIFGGAFIHWIKSEKRDWQKLLFATFVVLIIAIVFSMASEVSSFKWQIVICYLIVIAVVMFSPTYVKDRKTLPVIFTIKDWKILPLTSATASLGWFIGYALMSGKPFVLIVPIIFFVISFGISKAIRS